MNFRTLFQTLFYIIKDTSFRNFIFSNK